MSLRLVVGEDFPAALWMLDDTSPHVDSSGYNRLATSSSSLSHAALCKGASKAIVLGSGNQLSFVAPVYKRGKEHLPWSVEAWFRSIKVNDTSTATQQVFGNSGQLDGLTIAGTVISFSTKYLTTGEARCSFDIEDNAMTMAVGVHTPTKNILMVDGDVVAEVDITPEQQVDQYFSTGNSLTSGQTSGPNLLALNAVSVYQYALDESTVDSHYDEGTENLSEEAVAIAYKGINLQLTPDAANPVIQQRYDEPWLFDDGYFNNATIEYGQVIPMRTSTGLSAAGTWEIPFVLPSNLGQLYGVVLTWSGTGVMVETSMDGLVWNTVTKGVKTPTVPQGYVTEDAAMYVRAKFTGGILEDPSYFDNLVISAYAMGNVPPIDGRTVTLNKASVESDFDVMDYNENWGCELNDGTLTIGPRTTGSILPKTIQIWAKKKSTASFTDNITGATASYTNAGALVAYRPDEWQLRTYVFSGGFAGDIVFSGTGQIGTISLFPDAFSADDVASSYMSYVGVPTTVVESGGAMSVSSADAFVNIYEYEWSIESST